MRTLLLLVFGFSVMSGMQNASAAEEEPAASGPVVLITAFKPFAQRKVNGSETVAEALRRDQEEGFQVRVLVLEVQWQEPTVKLLPLVRQLRPRLLIGLGEGAAGSVMVERTARNHRVGRDEGGEIPKDRLIEVDGPPQRHGTLEFNQAWQLSREIAVSVSDDAGAFLCNAMYYTALGLDVPRVGFIHLPPQGAEGDEQYSDRFAPIVRELIRRNL